MYVFGLILISAMVTWSESPLMPFLHMSFWIPQIVFQARKNARFAFSPTYVWGVTLLRLCPFLCECFFPPTRADAHHIDKYGCPKTLTQTPTQPLLLVLLGVHVGWQLWLLRAQRIHGPRFLLPDSWLPPVYDYHRPVSSALGSVDPASGLPSAPQVHPPVPLQTRTANNDVVIHVDDATDPTEHSQLLGPASSSATGPHTLEDGLESGASSPAPPVPRGPATAGPEWLGWIWSPPQEVHGAVVRDCVICMLPVTVQRPGKRGQAYMLTPCQHLFHTDCLERWMQVKMECPTCRRYIPFALYRRLIVFAQEPAGALLTKTVCQFPFHQKRAQSFSSQYYRLLFQ